jgi:hypothetical protein
MEYKIIGISQNRNLLLLSDEEGKLYTAELSNIQEVLQPDAETIKVPKIMVDDDV